LENCRKISLAENRKRNATKVEATIAFEIEKTPKVLGLTMAGIKFQRHLRIQKEG